MIKPDGLEPAFPGFLYDGTLQIQPGGTVTPLAKGSHPGMALRDWFAGLAINGMYAGHAATTDGDFGGYAKAAYHIADALLAERYKA